MALRVLNSSATGTLPASRTGGALLARWRDNPGRVRMLAIRLACEVQGPVAAANELRRATIVFGDGSFNRSLTVDLEDGAEIILPASYVAVYGWSEAATVPALAVAHSQATVRAQAIICPAITGKWRATYTSQIQAVNNGAYAQFDFEAESPGIGRGFWHSLEPLVCTDSVNLWSVENGMPSEQRIDQRTTTDAYLFSVRLATERKLYRLEPQVYSLFWYNNSGAAIDCAMRFHAGSDWR